MTNIRLLAAAVAAVVLLIAPARAVRAQTLPVVHVMTVPIDAGAEVYFAKDMGFFTKEGLDVDIQPAANGGVSAAAVAGNAVDIAYSDMVSIASGVGRNVPFIVVAPAAVHESAAPVNLLLVGGNSTIRSAKDLDGKVVAGSGLGTISGYGPRAWIEANGGDLATVKFVELPFPQMQPALDAGRVDAVMIAEPFLTAARKSERVLASPYDTIGKTFLISAYFTTAAWAKDHPDVLNKFITAIREAAVWANANHAKSAEILLKYAKIDPDLAAKYSKFPPFPADQLIYKPAR
jgi:NitT/TauT family transport system substrate-binding protein